MGKVSTAILAFNRGLVSKLGMARIDVRRLGFSAEIMTNWMPRVLGSMMLRPGTKHLGSTLFESANRSTLVPFVFSASDKAVLSLGANALQVWVNDALITRPVVSTVVGDGEFADLSDWTDIDEVGAASATTGTRLTLIGNGTAFAGVKQQVVVSATDQNVEHALKVQVARGPVLFKVGSTDGGDEYVSETFLETGVHSLSFTPTGVSFWIYLRSARSYTVSIDSVAVESAGELSIDIPIDDTEVDYVRTSQSADVIYLASRASGTTSLATIKIERRAERSWSVVRHKPESGPFRKINNTDITLTPSAISGDITLTASRNFFEDGHQDGGLLVGHTGALFRIASVGQNVSAAIVAENTFTNPIRVVGVGDSRIFDLDITGTFSATVTLQFSVGEPGSWADLLTTYTTVQNTTIDDGLDNQIVYYRIGVKTGDFVSGTATCSLAIGSGSINGVVMVYAVASGTSASAVVLKDLGGLDATRDWWEGEWSDKRGYPSAVVLHDGRLWWLGRDRIWGSVSDDYENFDDETVGDAGPINRSIGSGPIQNIHWAMSLERLILGTAYNSGDVNAGVIDGNSPISATSSALDEPLTPSAFSLRAVSPVGVFVDRAQQRLYMLAFDGRDYAPDDLSKFTPDLNVIGIRSIAVQIKPDVRIHCVRTDGTVAVVVFDRAEGVYAWIEIETDGAIEAAACLPGDSEDDVYYIVKRTINSATVRYLEKWATEAECQGGLLNKQADSFFEYSGISTVTITGLTHLEGKAVVAWGAGKDLGEYTVASGSITLTEAVTSCIVGLKYTAKFKSTKLATIDGNGLCRRRNVTALGVIMRKAHYQGLQYGPDFANLYDLPKVEGGQTTADDTIWDDYDEDTFPFGGEWDTDARICLQAVAPRPCTLLAAVADIES